MIILKRVVPLFLTHHLQIEFQFEYTSEQYGVVDIATSFESAQSNFEKPYLIECYLDKPHLYPAHIDQENGKKIENELKEKWDEAIETIKVAIENENFETCENKQNWGHPEIKNWFYAVYSELISL